MPSGVSKGEQNLWYQTKGFYIVDGVGGNLQQGDGDYSPNTNPGPGGAAGDNIYQLDSFSPLSSTGGGQYQFRVYLTLNIATMYGVMFCYHMW